MDLAADAIERNRGWTRDRRDVEVDAFNARTMEGSRGIAFGEARVALEEARARLRTALSSLAEPSDGAKEAFFVPARSSTTRSIVRMLRAAQTVPPGSVP